MPEAFDSDTSGNVGEAAASADSALDSGVAGARARFQRLGSDVQDRARRVTEDVQDRARRVSEDVRRGAERAGEELRRGANVARERYDETAENVRRGYVQARDKAGHYSGELSEYVRENPGRSVLVAAGVGFLVGLLVRGRRSDDV